VNAAAAPVNTKAGRYRLPMTRQASTVLSGNSAGSTIRKDVPAAARFTKEPIRSGPPAAWQPPARQFVTAAEGLTQTTMVPRGPGPASRAEIVGHPATELLPFAISHASPTAAGAGGQSAAPPVRD